MNITFISHDAMLHGATRSMIDIADKIRSENIKTHVIIPKGGLLADFLGKKSIPHSVVSYPLLIGYQKKGEFFMQMRKMKHALKFLPNLVKTVKQTKPDVIYINTVTNYWMLLLKLFIKVPFIFHIREFGQPDHGILFSFNNLLFNPLRKLADVVVTNSHAVSKHYKENFDISSTVIHNGVVSIDDFEKNRLLRTNYLQSKTQNDNIIKVAIIGNVVAGKGQLEVVKAIQQLVNIHPNVKLYIFGGGPNIPTIENYIATNQLENYVEIVAFTNNLAGHYVSLDIVVVNSVMEAFGRVAIEAASYGIPVVSRNSGAIPEIIVDGKTGLLTDGSERDIALKLATLINDEKLRAKLGENGWNHARETFSLDLHVDKLRELFISQIARN
jgi:glycosyltransferase involved in cell wall biosynthesis